MLYCLVCQFYRSDVIGVGQFLCTDVTFYKNCSFIEMLIVTDLFLEYFMLVYTTSMNGEK